jgi:hypothetical protein
VNSNRLKSMGPALQVEATAPADKRRGAASKSAPMSGPEPISAYDIGKGAWPAFCSWLTAALHGVKTTIVRDEGADRHIVDCLDRPLEQIEAVVLPNAVIAIKITVQMNGKFHFFEVAGPSWLRLHYNAAGLPTNVEIGYAEGRLALRFNGLPAPGAVFTANSWGE